MAYRVFFGNIGYARGIDGTLRQHILRAHRHFYFGVAPQREVLGQVRAILEEEKPDLCCFVEIDSGSLHSAHLNQLSFLAEGIYPYCDIAGKYGESSWLGRMPFFQGKSNAFLCKESLPFDKLYFSHGSKRLIYRLMLPQNILLFFAHFSLHRATRAKQMEEIRTLALGHEGEVIILADFNIMQGFRELEPLLKETDLRVLNAENAPTFRLHNRQLTLDLCICSQKLADRAHLRVVPQPYSDHAALLIDF